MIRCRAEQLSAHCSPVGIGKQPGGDGAVPWICWSPATLLSCPAIQGDFQKWQKLWLPLTSAPAVNLLSFSPPKYLTPDSWCCWSSCICKRALEPRAESSGGILGAPAGPLLPALGHSALPGSWLSPPITGDYSLGWPMELEQWLIVVVLVSTCKWLLMYSPASFFLTKSSFLKTAQLAPESLPQGQVPAWPGGWALAWGPNSHSPSLAAQRQYRTGSVGLLSKTNVCQIRQSCLQLGQQHGSPPMDAHAAWLSSCPQVTPEQLGQHPWACQKGVGVRCRP